MKDKYTFIGFGELVVDKIYDKEGKLLKQDGGDTTWNILYHLGLMGETAYAIGGVGNDENSYIAIDSLKKAKVNTDYVEFQNKETNIIYSILEFEESGKVNVTFSEVSPFNGKKTFSISQSLPVQLPDKLKDKNKIIILMDLEKQNLTFIDSIKYKKVALDLGHIEFFKELDGEYILKFLKKVDICQLNVNVLKTLFEKLDVSDEIELYNLLNFELLIIAYGNRGAKFIYSDDEKIKETFKKPIRIVENAIDTSGAGDAFLSVILKSYNEYISQNKKIDREFIKNTFIIANMFSCQILQQIGCRATKKTITKVFTEYKQLYKYRKE